MCLADLLFSLELSSFLYTLLWNSELTDRMGSPVKDSDLFARAESTVMALQKHCTLTARISHRIQLIAEEPSREGTL